MCFFGIVYYERMIYNVDKVLKNIKLIFNVGRIYERKY